MKALIVTGILSLLGLGALTKSSLSSDLSYGICGFLLGIFSYLLVSFLLKKINSKIEAKNSTEEKTIKNDTKERIIKRNPETIAS